jgi:hypothetical protein
VPAKLAKTILLPRNACSASTAWKALPGNQSRHRFAAVSGSISPMNADWTINLKNERIALETLPVCHMQSCRHVSAD